MNNNEIRTEVTKIKYEAPVMEMVLFESEDIITTSVAFLGLDDEFGF